jgi:hypothetical protein
MLSVDVPSETVTIESLRESELQEARAIQLAMLASEGLRAAWVTIESEFQPVSEVGGDFLDYFLLSDGTEAGVLRGNAFAISTIALTAAHGAASLLITLPDFPFGAHRRYAEEVVATTLSGLQNRAIQAM